MKATDLAYNKVLGLRDAPAGAIHLLELPYSPLVLNHLGTIHAAAQFSLAEAASAECLQRQMGDPIEGAWGVVRSVEVKYRRPARSDLWAFGTPDPRSRQQLVDELAARGRVAALILIDLKDQAGTLTFHGKFEWFISRLPPSPA